MRDFHVGTSLKSRRGTHRAVVCAAFRNSVHLLVWSVDYFVRVVVTKCICITEMLHGVKTVSGGVLEDVAVPLSKDNYQRRYFFLPLHLIGHHHLHLVFCPSFILIVAGVW